MNFYSSQFVVYHCSRARGTCVAFACIVHTVHGPHSYQSAIHFCPYKMKYDVFSCFLTAAGTLFAAPVLVVAKLTTQKSPRGGGGEGDGGVGMHWGQKCSSVIKCGFSKTGLYQSYRGGRKRVIFGELDLHF